MHSVSGRLILLLAITFAVTLATMGLVKAAIEVPLPNAPWLQQLVGYQEHPQAAAEPDTVSPGPAYTYDLARPSRRFLMLTALAVFVGLRRWVPWGGLVRRAFGNGDRRWTRFGFGFSVGLALVVVYGAVILVGGLATATNRSLPYLVQRTLAYAAGATLIAVLEEVFFRGVLFRAMIRDWGVCRALTVSSAVYAGLHCVSGTFLVSPGWDPMVGWRLGLSYLAASSGSFMPDIRLMVGLFLLGVVLAVLYMRTGSLWASIGLHSGIVFSVKVFKKLADRIEDFPEWLLGDPLFVVSGVACWLLLAAALAAAAKLAPPGPLYRRLERRPGPSESR